MTTSVLHDVIANSTNLASSTRDKYLRDLNAWVDFAGNNPTGWTRRLAQAFYASLLKQMKAQSANRLMASVKYAAKWWAIQEENPSLNFAVIQEQKPKPIDHKQALTIEQTLAILNTCQISDPVGLRDLTMIVVALETGMRRMSLQSMTIEQAFLQSDPKTGYPTARVLMKGSSGERVMVPLSDTAIYCLSRWISWLDGHKIKHGPIFRALALKTAADDRVYHYPSSTALSESAIHKIIAERGMTALQGLLDVSPHMFRHTFVTWRLQAGYSPHEVAAVTGHKLRELGALGGYVDPIHVGQKMRASTPEWLRAYVAGRL